MLKANAEEFPTAEHVPATVNARVIPAPPINPEPPPPPALSPPPPPPKYPPPPPPLPSRPVPP